MQTQKPSSARPGDWLRKAISAARPGDTIEVPPGTHEGPFVIDKPINLSGYPAEE